jgi:hypothetical protein
LPAAGNFCLAIRAATTVRGVRAIDDNTGDAAARDTLGVETVPPAPPAKGRRPVIRYSPK